MDIDAVLTVADNVTECNVPHPAKLRLRFPWHMRDTDGLRSAPPPRAKELRIHDDIRKHDHRQQRAG